MRVLLFPRLWTSTVGPKELNCFRDGREFVDTAPSVGESAVVVDGLENSDFDCDL